MLDKCRKNICIFVLLLSSIILSTIFLPMDDAFAIDFSVEDLPGDEGLIATDVRDQSNLSEHPSDIFETDGFGFNTLKIDEAELGLNSNDNLDAYSLGHQNILTYLLFYFSIEDLGVEGLLGTDVRSESNAGEDAGDIFKSPADGTNTLYVDEGRDPNTLEGLGLEVDDNLDAVELHHYISDHAFFSVEDISLQSEGMPGTAVRVESDAGEVSADIFVSFRNGTNLLFLDESALGLLSDDNLDAVVVFDFDGDFVLDAGVDYVLFSVEDKPAHDEGLPGTDVRNQSNLGEVAGDIFISFGNGTNSLYVDEGSLGLEIDDNLDALDVEESFLVGLPPPPSPDVGVGLVVSGIKYPNKRSYDGRLRICCGDDLGDAPDSAPTKDMTRDENMPPTSDLLGIPAHVHQEGAVGRKAADPWPESGPAHEDIGEEWLGGKLGTFDVSPELYMHNDNPAPPHDKDADCNHYFGPNCVIHTVDNDYYDDGVKLFPPYIPGKPGKIEFKVCTENNNVIDAEGGRYVGGINFDRAATKKLFFNGFFDFNLNKVFDVPAEHIIHVPNIDPTSWLPNKCSPQFTVNFTVPATANTGEIWTRFRLDYGEDVGHETPPFPRYDSDTSLDPVGLAKPGGLAQFGEVEDYVIKPTFVRLSSFAATLYNGQILISWTTGAEIDNEGFNIQRGNSPDGPFVKINQEMIPSKAVSAGGAKYSFVDNVVVSDTSYYYKLEEVDNKGYRTEYGPVLAVAGEDKEENPTPAASTNMSQDIEDGQVTQNHATIYEANKKGSPDSDSVIVTTPYTIVANINGTARFLSGEPVESARITTAGAVEVQTIERITDKDQLKVRGQKSGVENQELEVKDQIDNTQNTNITLQEVKNADVKSPVSILFRIIDTEGNEVAIANIDVKSGGFAFQDSEATLEEDFVLRKSADAEKILLTWYATEPVKGFHILRSEKKEGPYHKITKIPIPYIGIGIDGQAFHYSYIDNNIQKGEDYYYKLEVIKKEEKQTAGL